MRLVTVQDKAAYDALCEKGILRCNPELADWLRDNNFRAAYNWLVGQMKLRVGKPPRGVSYPIWAWYLLDGKPAKADLRRIEFNNYRGENYILTVEVPDKQVLLSDEEAWHYVLNDWFLNDAKNEVDHDKLKARFNALPSYEKQKTRKKSWEKIFDITSFENDWFRRGCYVQATFWELRKEQVITVKRFIGRQNNAGGKVTGTVSGTFLGKNRPFRVIRCSG